MLFNDKEFGFKILVTLSMLLTRYNRKNLHLYLDHKWSTYMKVHSQKANNPLHLLRKYLSFLKLVMIDYI